MGGGRPGANQFKKQTAVDTGSLYHLRASVCEEALNYLYLTRIEYRSQKSFSLQ